MKRVTYLLVLVGIVAGFASSPAQGNHGAYRIAFSGTECRAGGSYGAGYITFLGGGREVRHLSENFVADYMRMVVWLQAWYNNRWNDVGGSAAYRSNYYYVANKYTSTFTYKHRVFTWLDGGDSPSPALSLPPGWRGYTFRAAVQFRFWNGRAVLSEVLLETNGRYTGHCVAR